MRMRMRMMMMPLKGHALEQFSILICFLEYTSGQKKRLQNACASPWKYFTISQLANES